MKYLDIYYKLSKNKIPYQRVNTITLSVLELDFLLILLECTLRDNFAIMRRWIHSYNSTTFSLYRYSRTKPFENSLYQLTLIHPLTYANVRSLIMSASNWLEITCLFQLPTLLIIYRFMHYSKVICRARTHAASF